MTSAADSVDEQRAPSEGGEADAADERLRRDLRAVVILGGLVRQTELTTAVDRAIMDLPIDNNMTVLDLWHAHLETLATDIGLDHLPVRIMTNQGSEHPTVRDRYERLSVEVEEDVADYRGTAGVLRDVLGDYDGQDLVLVLNGAQLMREPLSAISRDLSAAQSDVALVGHEDGTPSGVMLLRCGTLDGISDIGYVDMKEQALPQIAQRHRVSVVGRRATTGLPIRTLADYVRVLRIHHQSNSGLCPEDNMYAENWQPTFGIIETGATVSEGARIHDSVVLEGARVDPGAVLVQSVVCAGGVVRRNAMVTDQLVCLERPGGTAGHAR